MQQNIHPTAFERTKNLFCKLYIQPVSIFSHFLSLRAMFCFFILSYWSMNLSGIGVGWGPGHMHVDVHKVFPWIQQWLVHILLSEVCSRMCYYPKLIFYWSYQRHVLSFVKGTTETILRLKNSCHQRSTSAL